MILQNGKRLDGCSDTVPVGTLQPFAGLVPPKGYLICQGQLVSKTKYPQLYAICGSQFGEETTSDFYLPDLRGKTIAGYDSDNELVNTIGKLLGAESHVHATGNHTLTVEEMPTHHHTFRSESGSTTGSGTLGDHSNMEYILASGDAYPGHPGVSAGGTWGSSGTFWINDAGGSQPHNHGDTSVANNYQPTIVMNWIIKAVMLIPEYFIVENTLESNSVTNALSANQGRLLNEKFADYITYSESLANTQALSDRITALEEDNSLSGGTMEGNLLVTGTLASNGRLTAGELYSNGNFFWEGTKNFVCISRANNIEWSFDLGSTADGSNAGHTGTYAQFWSMKNQNTIISFHNDDDMVNIPNGKLHIHNQNSWHEGNNYDLRLGRADANHLDLGYDGMQAKNSSNGAAKLFFQYGGGDAQFGRDGATTNLTVYGNISLATDRAIYKGGSSYSWSTIRDSNTTALASITSYSGYHPILKQKTPSGVWGLGCYTSAVHFTYFADGTTHNSPTQLLELNYNGNSISAGGAALPHVWVQSGQPSAKQTGDIWFIP